MLILLGILVAIPAIFFGGIGLAGVGFFVYKIAEAIYRAIAKKPQVKATQKPKKGK